MIDQPHGLGLVKDAEQIAEDTVVGDIRDLLLQEARDTKNALPWTTRSEREQREIIERVDAFARRTARKVVSVLASRSHPSVQVLIDSVTLKDGIKIVCKAATTPENVEAVTSGTDTPMLVFVSTAAVSGERAPVVPLKDQPGLDGDDGSVFDRTPMGGA